MEIADTLTILLAGAITIALFSYLWKENLAFRIAEHAYVGAAAGYGALILADTAWDLLSPWLAKGLWYWYLTVLLGLVYLFFFSGEYFWLYRYPTAIVIGADIGTFVARSIKTQFLEQIRATTIVTNVNEAIVAIGVITGLFYFYSTMERKGVLEGAAKVGIYFLMAGFGASFGVTVMARISLLIGRLRFLYFTDPAYYLIPVAVILLIISIFLERSKKT
jgi:hypothetical protein